MPAPKNEEASPEKAPASVGKVAVTTKLRDPSGAIVTLRAGEDCPEWAAGRVATK